MTDFGCSSSSDLALDVSDVTFVVSSFNIGQSNAACTQATQEAYLQRGFRKICRLRRGIWIVMFFCILDVGRVRTIGRRSNR